MIKKSTFSSNNYDTGNIEFTQGNKMGIYYHVSFWFPYTMAKYYFHSDINYNKYPKHEPHESKASTLKPLRSDMKKKSNCN